MATLNFYKGESLNIIFTAYDNGTPPKLMDISGYSKTVEVFTPYSTKIIPQISNVSNNSFQINLLAEQTKNLNSGLFNIVVKLAKGDEIKIGKSIPCKILDPYVGCGPENLSVDNNQAKVDMKIDNSIINFDLFFGTANIMIDGTDANDYINKAVANKADTTNEQGTVARTPDGKIPQVIPTGMTNISYLKDDYALSLQEAINAVPSEQRKTGAIIRFSRQEQTDQDISLDKYILRNYNVGQDSQPRPDNTTDWVFWFPVTYGKSYTFYADTAWQLLLYEYKDKTAGSAPVYQIADETYVTKRKYTVQNPDTKYLVFCTRMNYQQWSFNISDSLMMVNDGANYIKSIATYAFTGDILEQFTNVSLWKDINLEQAVRYKRGDLVTVMRDITDLVTPYIRKNTGLNQNTGNPENWDAADSVVQYPLLSGTNYTVSGLGQAILFIKKKDGSLSRVLGDGLTAVNFTTQADEAYISFYVRIEQGESWDFNSTDTFRVAKKVQEPDYVLLMDDKEFPISKFGSNSPNGDSQTDNNTKGNNLPEIAAPDSLFRVDFTGSFSGMSADKSVTLPCKFNFGNGQVLSCYAVTKWQGNSSLVYPKKNFKIDLVDENQESVSIKIGKWVSCDSFHLKANYVDALHSRNVCCARLFERMTMTRTPSVRHIWDVYNDFTDYRKLYDTGALGHIDGYPCEVYLNGKYYGLYTFNLKKARSNYNMKKKNNNHIHFEMADNAAIIGLPVDWSKWEIRNPKGFESGVEPADGPVKTAILNFFSWAKDLTKTSTKEEFAERLFIPSMIDYAIFNWLIDNADGVFKNSQLVTLDGVHWTILPYDLDCAIGLWWDGASIFRKPTDATAEQPFITKFSAVYADEINARYAQLRSLGVITSKGITDLFNDFSLTIGVDAYLRDQAKWTGIPSKDFLSIYQIEDWITKRIAFLDQKYGYNN